MSHVTRPISVVMLTDVSVGYGTPQNLRLAESICKNYNARVHIFEPDQAVRPQIDIKKRLPEYNISLNRVFTTGNLFTQEGRIEFAQYVAPHIRNIKPDILIISGLYRLPVLDMIDHDHMIKIFYCLEEVTERHKYIFPLVNICDILIFPEENRRRIYLERTGFRYENNYTFVIMNTNNNNYYTDEKNGKLLYAGSFHKEITFGYYFFHEEVYALPIDIFGIIDGFPNDERRSLFELFTKPGGARYRGYFETDDNFFRMISRYLFSIITWLPDVEDRYYAAPNKLFDALSCGLPVISAPHPQCEEIIRKYNCGILMDDWTMPSYVSALNKALNVSGTEYYKELVDNCRTAMREDLSWDAQFSKLRPVIDKLINKKLIQTRDT
ncbi:hypothetical protein GCM10011316_36660 [Roseibium aquae]|uniref:Glycosyltransferase involved in cell wall biosynthesis n=1 Tax=Roseibium aquae TaxID=1323746 RepID=A0A916TN56_9HYPH|nr:glycosyltransferase [Roseibium aquae]GGB61332.1 hypothetical protein GCM10011316_36660 [Roseibium aquae]